MLDYLVEKDGCDCGQCPMFAKITCRPQPSQKSKPFRSPPYEFRSAAQVGSTALPLGWKPTPHHLDACSLTTGIAEALLLENNAAQYAPRDRATETPAESHLRGIRCHHRPVVDPCAPATSSAPQRRVPTRAPMTGTFTLRYRPL